LQPERLHRRTGSEQDEGEGDDEGDDCDDVDPGSDAKGTRYAAVVEAAVEEEDGGFYEAAGEDVEEVDCEGDFALRDVEGGGYVPNVAVDGEVFGGYSLEISMMD